MASMLLALLAAVQEPPPERFSVLAPVPPAECVERTNKAGDVVVCGATPELSQRLPLPDERTPDGPTASNPHLTGRRALIVASSPCATLQGGCQVGIGPPPALIGALLDVVKDATRRKPDKRGRVPIDLTER